MEIMLQECPQTSQVIGTWQLKHPLRGYISPLHCSNKILFFDNQPFRHRADDGEIVQPFMQVITKAAVVLATGLKRKGFLIFPHTSRRAMHSIALCFV